MFCNNTKSLENKMTNNFVNESYLFTQISYIVKTYTTTAQEPSIYTTTLVDDNIFLMDLTIHSFGKTQCFLQTPFTLQCTMPDVLVLNSH